jgi:hypothetical protein
LTFLFSTAQYAKCFVAELQRFASSIVKRDGGGEVIPFERIVSSPSRTTSSVTGSPQQKTSGKSGALKLRAKGLAS